MIKLCNVGNMERKDQASMSEKDIRTMKNNVVNDKVAFVSH